MNKERIYIAGPMSGLKDLNYPAFDDAAVKLRLAGYEVVNPVEIGEELCKRHGITTEELAKNEALMFKLTERELCELVECSAIYLLHGWENSKGAKRELGSAIYRGLRVIVEGEAAWQGRSPAIKSRRCAMKVWVSWKTILKEIADVPKTWLDEFRIRRPQDTRKFGPGNWTGGSMLYRAETIIQAIEEGWGMPREEQKRLKELAGAEPCHQEQEGGEE